VDALDIGDFVPERRGVGAFSRQVRRRCHGDQPLRAFVSTLVAFFLAEIGDKTQIATVGLAARFEVFYAVVAGTTLGMMLANIPAVILGDRIADKLPVKAIRITAAVVFAGLGVVTLIGVGT
jgi:Ca2+/H+ antiporter, TMEM165/GDT1 family